MNDANGVEITIGCKVRHKYWPPLMADEKMDTKEARLRAHELAMPTAVLGFVGSCVEVKRTGVRHIPIHRPELLVVIDPENANVG